MKSAKTRHDMRSIIIWFKVTFGSYSSSALVVSCRRLCLRSVIADPDRNLEARRKLTIYCFPNRLKNLGRTKFWSGRNDIELGRNDFEFGRNDRNFAHQSR